MKKHRHALLACLLCILMAACVSGPSRPGASEYNRIPSTAISQSEKTSLGDSLAPQIRAHKTESGFRLLPNGDESLRVRLAMVLAAEKTLDIQYYAMHDDSAANLMLEAILRAAERGVRVRFLLDNISLSDVEKSLSILDGNKNIQVRVFNPVSTKDQGLMSRINGLFVDLDKDMKRMHNKSLIADNQLSIVGGRNIGDEYFDAQADSNFKDMDLLIAGPVTARISASFDKYWNSDEAFPIAALVQKKHDQDAVKKLREDMKAVWEKENAKENGKGMLSAELAKDLKSQGIQLIWAPAELTVDDPGKIDKEAAVSNSKPLAKLKDLAADTQSEFIAVSPYFVPRDSGVAILKGLEDRGVQVRILTNSLASTDVVAVHTGYKDYREDILKAGIELYEFKAGEGGRPKQRLLGSSAPPQASLHSKMYVFDRKIAVIGSYNLDPRSTELNTEIAVVIHSPVLAQQVVDVFEKSIAPAQSYQVVLTDKGSLEWITQEDGKEKIYTHDPKAGVLRNVESFVFSALPIEDQL